jgi:hypothetical protein
MYHVPTGIVVGTVGPMQYLANYEPVSKDGNTFHSWLRVAKSFSSPSLQYSFGRIDSILVLGLFNVKGEPPSKARRRG